MDYGFDTSPGGLDALPQLHRGGTPLEPAERAV